MTETDYRRECKAVGCQKTGTDRYDRFNIYAGRYCDDHIPACAREDENGEKWDYRDPFEPLDEE